jgi:hypothetical protein
LKFYHEYCAKTEEEALREIENIHVDDHDVEAVFFPGMGWAIMLDTAAEEIRKLGII